MWVVVPTYDEAENVGPLLEALLHTFDASGLSGRVLVVDDGSPDGTADLAAAVARRDPRVAVLRRRAKEGIGPAYRAGFRAALAAGAALVVEMDCDFSHDPARVPDLVAAARRRRPGDRLALRARRRRRPLGPRAARDQPGRVLVRPPGAGRAGARPDRRLQVLPAGVLEAIPLDQVGGAGYVFQVEMTYRALLAGYRVTEVPITFTERAHGRSKMSRRIVLEAAVRVPALRRRLGRVVR